MRRPSRRSALLLAAPFVVVACSGSGSGDDGALRVAGSTLDADDTESAAPEADEAVAEPVDQIAPSPADITISGLDMYRGETPAGAPEPLVDLADIRSGGPPPDGIPSIDDPRFLTVDGVDFLEDDEPVLAMEIDGDARAYPVQVLMWHEIVNDTVGGIPVAVTYCPLCNSAVAYDRRVGDRVMEFGTSGLLWNSALVMYDRQTETLWSHFTGQGIVGELTGVEIETFPVATVSWAVWRDAHPEGLVLSRDTGFDRAYGVNPYPGYDDVNSRPFLFEGEVDGRYTAMTRLAGVERDGEALGVPLIALQERRVVEAELADVELVFFWQPGTASALDAGDVADGADVGATGVFVPVVDGRRLTFTAQDDTFVDAETESTWNLLGQAVDGPLTGSALEAVAHVDTFWFAWSAFRPGSAIIDG